MGHHHGMRKALVAMGRWFGAPSVTLLGDGGSAAQGSPVLACSGSYGAANFSELILPATARSEQNSGAGVVQPRSGGLRERHWALAGLLRGWWCYGVQQDGVSTAVQRHGAAERGAARRARVWGG